jgi:hypothetical protein
MSSHRNILRTPKEILELHPMLSTKYGWTESVLGVLFKAHILWGNYDSSRRTCMIDDTSVVKLINFLNQSMDDLHLK